MMAPTVFAMLLLAVAVFQLMCKPCLMRTVLQYSMHLHFLADRSEDQRPHASTDLAKSGNISAFSAHLSRQPTIENAS